jgi:hypothetical protein
MAEIFNEIVGTMPSDHFHTCDRTLLELYCFDVWSAREAQRYLQTEGQVTGGRLSLWINVLEKASKSATMLSMKLRIAPQARTRPETLSRKLNRETPSGYVALDLKKQTSAWLN